MIFHHYYHHRHRRRFAPVIVFLLFCVVLLEYDFGIIVQQQYMRDFKLILTRFNWLHLYLCFSGVCIYTKINSFLSFSTYMCVWIFSINLLIIYIHDMYCGVLCTKIHKYTQSTTQKKPIKKVTNMLLCCVWRSSIRKYKFGCEQRAKLEMTNSSNYSNVTNDNKNTK